MKIIKMKELAISYNLKNAKNKKFKTTEQYLEYIIDEINTRANKYSFHQFLFLIDVLYVVLNDIDDNIPDTLFSPQAEIKEHYKVRPTSDAEMVAAYDKKIAIESTKKIEKLEEDISDNLFDHKLKWQV